MRVLTLAAATMLLVGGCAQKPGMFHHWKRLAVDPNCFGYRPTSWRHLRPECAGALPAGSQMEPAPGWPAEPIPFREPVPSPEFGPPAEPSVPEPELPPTPLPEAEAKPGLPPGPLMPEGAEEASPGLPATPRIPEAGPDMSLPRATGPEPSTTPAQNSATSLDFGSLLQTMRAEDASYEEPY